MQSWSKALDIIPGRAQQNIKSNFDADYSEENEQFDEKCQAKAATSINSYICS